MLKICISLIYKLLETVFKIWIETGVFLSEWKKDNIASIHKKRQQTSTEKLPSSLVATYLQKIY